MDEGDRKLYNSNMRQNTIQTYNLFGETSELPDVVHCETISARSNLHNGTFSAHRHAGLHQMLLVAHGRGQAEVEGKTHPLVTGTLVNLPHGVVHAFTIEAGTVGWVLTIAREVIDELLKAREGLHPVLARPYVGPGFDGCSAMMNNLFTEYRGMGFARAHLLRMAAGQILGRVARHLEAARDDATQDAALPPLLRRFLSLLDQHFSDQKSVADYARILAVSPTHLSRICRAATGRPASKLIEERLIREARRMLIYTNLSVAEIAYALGFNDPAYFSRAFQRATGQTPSVLRKPALAKQADGP